MHFHFVFLTVLLALIHENSGYGHNQGRSNARVVPRGRSMQRGRSIDPNPPPISDNEVPTGPMVGMDGEAPKAVPMAADQPPVGPAPPPETGVQAKPTAGASGDGNDQFSVMVGGKLKRVIFRLSNRLAVAVCDTYDNYLATGKPHAGPIMYNVTVQELRSKVDPTVCQSFKIRRCNVAEDLPDAQQCGWTRTDTC